MDIELKTNSIELKIKDLPQNSNNKDYVFKLFEVIRANFIDGTPTEGSVRVEVKEKKPEKIKPIGRDKPVIRDRLPNTVDLSELDIISAVTKEPMVRCPSCGQTNTVVIDFSPVDVCLLCKIYEDNKPTYKVVSTFTEEEIEQVYMPKSANPLDYYTDLINALKNKSDEFNVNVELETTLICPICQTKNSFERWSDAYKYPLEMGFETESLCDVCGHEAVSVINENKQEVITCESCGYSKVVS